MKNNTIPRGYRLKESTHRLIKKVQDEMNLSQDKVISKAMRLYYSTTKTSITGSSTKNGAKSSAKSSTRLNENNSIKKLINK